jgi:hypothetical protein
MQTGRGEVRGGCMEFLSFRYRGREEEYEHPRREFLVRALALGLLTAGGAVLGTSCAPASRPRKLAAGRSIYRLRGDVRVNGQPADLDTEIRPTDRIDTGSASELIFVVGRDAFILRENSELYLDAAPIALASAAGDDVGFGQRVAAGLRLVTGRVLSVFGRREDEPAVSVRTPVATVGVRGTGMYVESHPDRSYVCTCYGSTRLLAVDDPASREDVASDHHDDPRYILAAGPAGRRIVPAPMINHTDMELLLIEELVGRVPPFSVIKDGYGTPRDPAGYY